MPPLSISEKALLKESLERDGQKYPVLVLPDGRIIDGYHRFQVLGEKAKYQILDVGENKALDLAMYLNVARRQLSYEQIREVKEKVKDLVIDERKKGKTQEEISKTTHVPRQTIYRWLNNDAFARSGRAHTSIRIPTLAKETIAERAKE